MTTSSHTDEDECFSGTSVHYEGAHSIPSSSEIYAGNYDMEITTNSAKAPWTWVEPLIEARPSVAKFDTQHIEDTSTSPHHLGLDGELPCLARSEAFAAEETTTVPVQTETGGPRPLNVESLTDEFTRFDREFNAGLVPEDEACHQQAGDTEVKELLNLIAYFSNSPSCDS
jgi:hypothetical protein